MSTLSLLDAIERPPILGGGDRDRDGRVERDGVRRPGPSCDRDARDGVRRPAPNCDRDGDARVELPRVGGSPTLDDLLTATWDALTLGLPATCPMCAGTLEPRHGAGHAPVAGRCTRCGTELS